MKPNWPAQVAVTSAVLAVLVVVVTYGALLSGFFVWQPGAAPSASGGVGLPPRVGAPGIWTADEIEHPLAAASVLVSGDTWFFDGSGFYGGLIGGGYRVFVNDAGAAGLGAVLSPDGRRLASGDGILDIAAGRWTPYPQAWKDRELAAQAWSPDGRRVAVTSRSTEDKPPYPGSSNGTATSLNLLEVATGAITEVAELDDGATLDGWTAAFSPDGTMLAFQARDRVRVLTLADRKTVDLPLPDGARLAGKGSWTRDGRGLLVVAGEGGRTVTTLSAATGEVAGPQYRVDDADEVRVLGWWPSGRPVVAAYTAEDDVRLLELTPGSGQHQLSAIGTETVDVADDVLAAGRLGDSQVPASSLDGILKISTVVAGIAAAVALLSGAWAFKIRANRRQDPV